MKFNNFCKLKMAHTKSGKNLNEKLLENIIKVFV